LTQPHASWRRDEIAPDFIFVSADDEKAAEKPAQNIPNGTTYAERLDEANAVAGFVPTKHK
jgi:hypothetical protein